MTLNFIYTTFRLVFLTCVTMILASCGGGDGDGSGDGGCTDSNTINGPTITTSTFDWSTGHLVITGTNFVSAAGATNDIDSSRLTIMSAGSSYTLTDTADVEITSATSATVALSATDLLTVRGLLNKNGTQTEDATPYDMEAADNWMAGSAAAKNIADCSRNDITVSNVATPTITNAFYDSDEGTLQVSGTNLFKKPGAANDIDLSTLTFAGGVGNQTYNLTTATDTEIASATSFTTTLAGADKVNVDTLLDQIGSTSSGGSTYNLAAADNWLTGADAAANIADTINAVIVSINPKVTSATYNATTGVLVVTGTNIQANGGGSDIDASLFTFTGEAGSVTVLTGSGDVNRDSVTQFTLTLSATDRAAVNQILNKNGSSSTDGTLYNLAAADDWNTNVTIGDTSDAAGNGITVSGR